jgi:NAD(P)-dependent dehydrogenase (short-subunit alcohol dehydrogenase family)
MIPRRYLRLREKRGVMDLKDKRVLVTGGAVRAGRFLCGAFAGAGAKVTAHYNSSEDGAASLLDTLGGEKAGHMILRRDLGVCGSAAALMAAAGDIDILINSASVYREAPLAEESFEAASEQFMINFWAPLELMKLLRASCVEKSKPGVVINILDQRVYKTGERSGSYSLSKTMLAEATKAAALQWSPLVRVNAVAPGPLLPPRGMENSKMERTVQTLPLKRSVSLQDFAEACLFLVRNESVTGEILYVDCGQSLVR